MERLFQQIINYSLLVIIFLFPFFFLPITQEFFLTNKLYLLSFGILFLLLISTIKLITSKKISWQKGAFDNFLVLFLIALTISTVLSSPNKIQAILNPNFGLLTFFSLTILYFYLSRISINFYKFLSISTLFLSILAIIFFFQPFKNTNLPQSLQFLKNPSFTPIGSQIDLAIFLGFFVVLGLKQIFDKTRKNTNEGKNLRSSAFLYLWLSVIVVALSFTLYSLLRPSGSTGQALVAPQSLSQFGPPFRLSWYAAVEILKNWPTLFFGIGIDNFSSIFSRIKDAAYNQSNLWLIYSFNSSRSAILHLFTETGILGFLSFFLIIFQAIKLANREKNLLVIGYLLLVIFLFPVSLITWFLFFLVLAELSDKDVINHVSGNEINLANLLPFYITTTVVSFIFIIGMSYLLGRSYAAEIYFKKGLDGVVKNDAKQSYDNMRQAIILNPYIERYRINFSQLNLILANNIANKARPSEGSNNNNQPTQLSEQDRQAISQAIQAAIAEAKAAVSLNPQKAVNWENLAEIYRNIINTAQGADVWTISAYQRAIIADPQNPIYRLNLGGVYYSLGNFEEAAKIFEQAVVLKPDWANAYYNLAWANYQRQNYQAAVFAMENVTRLLDPKKDKVDYDKAKKELEEFKKKLPQEEPQASNEANVEPKLTLPSPIPTITPQIQLPKEASPEAK